MGEVEIESREESRLVPRKKKREGMHSRSLFYEAAFLANGVGPSSLASVWPTEFHRPASVPCNVYHDVA
jgi:hypothetical protein